MVKVSVFWVGGTGRRKGVNFTWLSWKICKFLIFLKFIMNNIWKRNGETVIKKLRILRVFLEFVVAWKSIKRYEFSFLVRCNTYMVQRLFSFGSFWWAHIVFLVHEGLWSYIWFTIIRLETFLSITEMLL